MTTGMLMTGNMSTTILERERIPSRMMSREATATVYGRRRAVRTSHMRWVQAGLNVRQPEMITEPFSMQNADVGRAPKKFLFYCAALRTVVDFTNFISHQKRRQRGSRTPGLPAIWDPPALRSGYGQPWCDTTTAAHAAEQFCAPPAPGPHPTGCPCPKSASPPASPGG